MVWKTPLCPFSPLEKPVALRAAIVRGHALGQSMADPAPMRRTVKSRIASHLTRLATDAIIVAVKAVRVLPYHAESSMGYVGAVEVGRWRWDANAGIGRVASRA
jgi:hypothetical protein